MHNPSNKTQISCLWQSRITKWSSARKTLWGIKSCTNTLQSTLISGWKAFKGRLFKNWKLSYFWKGSREFLHKSFKTSAVNILTCKKYAVIALRSKLGLIGLRFLWHHLFIFSNKNSLLQGKRPFFATIFPSQQLTATDFLHANQNSMTVAPKNWTI